MIRVYCIFLALLLCIALPLRLWAQTSETKESRVFFQTQSKNSIPLLLRTQLNSRGQKEVLVLSERIQEVATEQEARLLIGRDTDDDGVFDAWFLLGKGGVVGAWDIRATTENGWDVAEQLLRTHEKSLPERNLIAVWGACLGHWSAGRKTLLDAEKTQIDLHEIEIRTDRLFRLDPRNPVVRENYTFLASAWSAMAEEFGKKIHWKIGEAIAETGLTLAGGTILRALGIRLSESAFAQTLSRGYYQYLGRFLESTQAALSRIKARIPTKLSETFFPEATASSAIRVTSKNMNHFINQTLQQLDAQNKLSHALAYGLKQSWHVGRAAVTKTKYIVQVTLIQIAVELMERQKVLFDLDTPILLPERVTSAKEMAQNVAFMTVETGVGSGIAVLNRNHFVKKMIVAGVFSTFDSAFWGMVIKNTTDGVRLAIDTGWEVTIGNAQTTIIDPLALGTGQMLASKFHNPNLRLVGWALTYVDQAVGYFAYNKATGAGYDALRKIADTPTDPNLILHLVPIYSP